MFAYDDAIVSKVEEQLRLNCPAPENELVRLSQFAADLPDNEEGARIRLLIVDIDDLVAQTRWHLGQALLLMETQPHILVKEEPTDPIEKMVSESDIPSKALLLLRGYIRDADRVLYSDLAEPRRSGTVAGWVYHMMIDNAVYRVIATLDRLAQILWYAAKLPTTYKKGERVKVYFRSRKMVEIDKAVNNEHSHELVKIAGNPLVEYVIGYRDGLAHDMKVYSQLAGARPTDEWTTPDGKRFIVKHDKWDAEMLFALGNATYHQLLDALKPAIAICESQLSSNTSS